jgi:uncharacterized RDD family membrane protein YckC
MLVAHRGMADNGASKMAASATVLGFFMTDRKRQLDGRIEIVTPENIAFGYRVAGPFWRLPAYLIDIAIQIAVILVTFFCFALALGSIGLGRLGIGLWLILFFVVSWFYGGLFETLWNGQTPGKRMLRLRVVTVDGQPINALQAVLRNLLRAVDALPVLPIVGVDIYLPLYTLGLLAAAANPRFQRLGDLVCDTMVIIEEPERRWGVTRLDEPEVAALAAALPPNFVAGHDLSRALSKYVGRRATFAPARRAEIARHLGQPLLEKFNLPPGTSHDLLLCALYHRAFISDHPVEPRAAPAHVMAEVVPAPPVVEVVDIRT